MVFRAQRQKVFSGPEGLVGEEGAARSDIAPTGKVFVHGEIWDASSGEPVAEGETVLVTAVDNLKLTVVKKK